MEEERALEVRPKYDVVDITDYAMTAHDVIKQVELIQDVMKKVMKEGEHYGTIPGCEKPSLYKPGAEKLSVTFRLAPTYKITKTDLPRGHREYEIVCTLTHIPSGLVFAQGVGSCSTMEGKYRFRDNIVFTGKPVPSAYWKDRSVALLGGKGFKHKKNPETDKWEIAKVEGKVEHDNPADYYNTVLKMSKKRSHTDAVLTATATSDIFTQDHPEDPEPNGQGGDKKQPDGKKETLGKPSSGPGQNSVELGKKQQIARLQNKLNTNGIPQYRFEECIGNPLEDVGLSGLTAMLDFWAKTQEKYEAWLKAATKGTKETAGEQSPNNETTTSLKPKETETIPRDSDDEDWNGLIPCYQIEGQMIAKARCKECEHRPECPEFTGGVKADSETLE